MTHVKCAPKPYWETGSNWRHGDKLATELPSNVMRVASVASVAKVNKGPWEKKILHCSSGCPQGLVFADFLHGVLLKSGDTGNIGNTHDFAGEFCRQFQNQTGDIGDKQPGQL